MPNSSFSLEKPKRSEGWAKLQEWNRKWNRILATIFGILCFILLFAIVIVNIVETQDEKDSTDYSDDRHVVPYSTMNDVDVETVCTKSGTTSITCNKGTQDQIKLGVDYIMDQNEQITEIDKLWIQSYKEDILRVGWLDTKNTYKIKTLELYGMSFNAIEDYAFNSTSLERTTRLDIKKCQNLEILTAGSFLGLERIEFLEFTTTNIKRIESGVLAPLRFTLSVLSMMSNSPVVDIQNFTGDVILSKVTMLTFTYNSFASTINDQTFSKTPNVESLYLFNSGIESITQNAFQPMAANIKLIHLNNNALESVPSGLFKNIIQKPGINLHLGGNFWTCDCEMLEFRDILLEHQSALADIPMCSPTTPLLDFEIDCSITSTIEPTSEPTTEDNNITVPSSQTKIRIYCTDNNATQSDVNNPEEPYEIYSKTAEFIIYEDKNEKVFVKFDKLCPDTALVWFHNLSNYDDQKDFSTLIDNYKCVANLDMELEIIDIDYNIHYIFCIIRQDVDVISPFDCAPFIRFKKPNLPSAFLTEDQKLAAILIFIFSIITAIILGGFLVICLLRCTRPKPTNFIKTTDIVDYGGYHIPAIYMTPTPPRTSFSERPSFDRRISESSIDSARSYVSAVTPTPLELLSWRMDRQRKISSKIENPVYLEKLPNNPPPLPPHPNRRSNQSTTSSSTVSTEPLVSISYRLERDRDSIYGIGSNSYA